MFALRAGDYPVAHHFIAYSTLHASLVRQAKGIKQMLIVKQGLMLVYRHEFVFAYAVGPVHPFLYADHCI